MVRETTETIEVEKSIIIADRVGEGIHFAGDQVAVSGRFEKDKYTADIDTFDAALTAIDAGVKCVDVNEYISIISREEEDSKHQLTLKNKSRTGTRRTTLEELQEALDRSRSL